MRKVDIVIPIHGSGSFLSSTLKSIESQDYTGSIRVICILDRAEETVIVELEKWSTRLNLFIVQSEGTGISNALNTGIRFSNAEYIFRIDDDDMMTTDRIRKQTEIMDSTGSSLAILGSNITRIDPFGNVIGRKKLPLGESNVLSMANFGNPFAHSAVCIRSEAIKNKLEYRSFYEPAEDFDLWTRILDSWNGSNLKDYLTSYRMHAHQISRKNQFRQLAAREAVIASQALRRQGKQELNLRYESIDDWLVDPIGGPTFRTKLKINYEYFFRSKFRNPFVLNIILALFILLIDRNQFLARAKNSLGRSK